MSWEYSENRLVQDSAGKVLRDTLDWNLVFAYYSKVLGLEGVLTALPSEIRNCQLAQDALLPVALLAALGKQHELKGHVRGALNNGATVQEIQEVLLHTSIYCGVPTAVDAFRSAAEVIDGPKKPA